MSMTVTLNPLTDERVRRQVDSGRYPDATAVLDRAVEMLEREEKLRALRELIAEAEEDIANGDVFEWTPESMAQLWAEADEDERLGVPIPGHVEP